ncbi:hypothetical protein SAMN05421503_2455 [Terribacillus aidingensis]|jgi:hypothetical protein|uniref:Uncharacterized protein n=1 Tax=Terribacillus aidingensis TaxID=586416 RepID=A0A285P016_9BACI|nr:hypothetical protein SAMN05421503_2455 [Terribacillus aidingensis]
MVKVVDLDKVCTILGIKKDMLKKIISPNVKNEDKK